VEREESEDGIGAVIIISSADVNPAGGKREGTKPLMGPPGNDPTEPCIYRRTRKRREEKEEKRIGVHGAVIGFHLHSMPWKKKGKEKKGREGGKEV